MSGDFEEIRDTPSGYEHVAVELGVPIVKHEDFDQPRLILTKDKKPWFLALPSWWPFKKGEP